MGSNIDERFANGSAAVPATEAVSAAVRGPLLLLLIGALLALSATLPAVARTAAQEAEFAAFNLDGSPDPDRPFRLPAGVEAPQAIYGSLSSAGDGDYYAFTAPADAALNVTLIVAEGCDGFRPAMAVIGPGLTGTVPSAADGPPPGAPAPPVGGGTVIVAGDEWGTLVAPEADVTVRTGPRLGLPLTGGAYRIAVYDPAGGSGAYALVLGGDLLPLPDADPATAAAFDAWRRCGEVGAA